MAVVYIAYMPENEASVLRRRDALTANHMDVRLDPDHLQGREHWAYASLGAMGPAASSALPIMLANGQDPQLRLPIVRAVTQFGSAAAAVVPLLTRYLDEQCDRLTRMHTMESARRHRSGSRRRCATPASAGRAQRSAPAGGRHHRAARDSSAAKRRHALRSFNTSIDTIAKGCYSRPARI